MFSLSAFLSVLSVHSGSPSAAWAMLPQCQTYLMAADRSADDGTMDQRTASFLSLVATLVRRNALNPEALVVLAEAEKPLDPTSLEGFRVSREELHAFRAAFSKLLAKHPTESLQWDLIRRKLGGITRTSAEKERDRKRAKTTTERAVVPIVRHRFDDSRQGHPAQIGISVFTRDGKPFATYGMFQGGIGIIDLVDRTIDSFEGPDPFFSYVPLHFEIGSEPFLFARNDIRTDIISLTTRKRDLSVLPSRDILWHTNRNDHFVAGGELILQDPVGTFLVLTQNRWNRDSSSACNNCVGPDRIAIVRLGSGSSSGATLKEITVQGSATKPPSLGLWKGRPIVGALTDEAVYLVNPLKGELVQDPIPAKLHKQTDRHSKVAFFEVDGETRIVYPFNGHPGRSGLEVRKIGDSRSATRIELKTSETAFTVFTFKNTPYAAVPGPKALTIVDLKKQKALRGTIPGRPLSKISVIENNGRVLLVWGDDNGEVTIADPISRRIISKSKVSEQAIQSLATYKTLAGHWEALIVPYLGQPAIVQLVGPVQEI